MDGAAGTEEAATAEKAARRAEWWGRRLQQARDVGPEEVAAVTFDRARKALDGLPGDKRQRGYEALERAIDQVRETHAQ